MIFFFWFWTQYDTRRSQPNITNERATYNRIKFCALLSMLSKPRYYICFFLFFFFSYQSNSFNHVYHIAHVIHILVFKSRTWYNIIVCVRIAAGYGPLPCISIFRCKGKLYCPVYTRRMMNALFDYLVCDLILIFILLTFSRKNPLSPCYNLCTHLRFRVSFTFCTVRVGRLGDFKLHTVWPGPPVVQPSSMRAYIICERALSIERHSFERDQIGLCMRARESVAQYHYLDGLFEMYKIK